MKKIFFVTLIVALTDLSCISTVSGQNSSNIEINVSARVISHIELVTLRNMKFENVQPGQREIYLSPIMDSGAGKMVAKGIPNARMWISFLRRWELNNDQSDGKLVFYYSIAGGPEDSQNSAELLQTDNRSLQFNEEGEYFFWIGGRVNIENAQPGNYEGEFTIEIEYI